MNLKQEIGKQIKKMRILNDYTQEKLSEKIGISQRALSSIELGNNFVSSDTLEKILTVFNITLEEFFATDCQKESSELLFRINKNIEEISDNPDKLYIVYNLTKSLKNC